MLKSLLRQNNIRRIAKCGQGVLKRFGDFEYGGFLPARRYAGAGNSDRNVSVRLSVRHGPVLCQNEES